jgi:hypothetical protein
MHFVDALTSKFVAQSIAMAGLASRCFAVMTLAALGACAPAPLGFSALPGQSSTASESGVSRNGFAFQFTTLDDPYDPTFNRLLAINNQGHIVGYYGNGSFRHRSKGYVIYPPYQAQDFKPIVYPEAPNTIASAEDNDRMVGGTYGGSKVGERAFVELGGIWTNYADPFAHGRGAKTEILSLDDDGIAVGFYQTPTHTGAFQLDVATGIFSSLHPTDGTDAVATSLTTTGEIVGYTLNSQGHAVSFLRRDGTYYANFNYPGAISTEFLSINVHDQIVGSYVDRDGLTHGFVLVAPLWKGKAWQRIDAPNARTTAVTSINIDGDIVGYYVDGGGHTHGFLGTLSSKR